MRKRKRMEATCFRLSDLIIYCLCDTEVDLRPDDCRGTKCTIICPFYPDELVRQLPKVAQKQFIWQWLQPTFHRNTELTDGTMKSAWFKCRIIAWVTACFGCFITCTAMRRKQNFDRTTLTLNKHELEGGTLRYPLSHFATKKQWTL